jgi:hypothetical protein
VSLSALSHTRLAQQRRQLSADSSSRRACVAGIQSFVCHGGLVISGNVF